MKKLLLNCALVVIAGGLSVAAVAGSSSKHTSSKHQTKSNTTSKHSKHHSSKKQTKNTKTSSKTKS